MLPWMTTAMLVVDGQRGDRRSGEVSLTWFDRCWTLVGAQFAESLLTDPLPEADIREAVSAGMSYLHYPGRGHPFAHMVISSPRCRGVRRPVAGSSGDTSPASTTRVGPTSTSPRSPHRTVA